MSANGFIRIERSLWNSSEVLALSALAKLLLVELHYRHNGRNNGSICLPYQTVVDRLHCSHATVKRAFRDLHRAGLIETAVKGSFDHKDGTRKGTGNQYRLTFVK